MRRLVLIVLLTLMVVSAYAYNQQTFQQVEQLLAQAKQVRGDYSQTRHIKLLAKPLVSTGTFVLARQQGLIWNQITPFKSQLKLSDNKLEQQLGDNPPTVLTKAQQPIIFSFTKLFLAIFKGNTRDLNQYFQVNFAGNLSSWTMTLTPKYSPLNKAIARIELAGSRHIKQVTMKEVRGNQMLIQFSKVAVER